MANEAQLLTKAFYGLLTDKPSSKSKYFVIQMNIAKKLLKDYSLDDLLCLIDYLKLFPLKNGISSMSYIPYIIDKELPKAKTYKATKELKARDLKVERDTKIINQINISAKSALFVNNIKF